MHTTRRRNWRPAPAALAAPLVTLIACGDAGVAPGDPGPRPDTVVAGTYRLASVDGHPLPALAFEATVPTAEGSFRLVAVAEAGEVELTADGRYRESMRHRVAVDGVPAPGGRWTDRGLWSAVGDVLRLRSELVQDVRFDAVRDGDGLVTRRDYLGEGLPASYRFEKAR